jgi:hypothetical protein
MNHNIDPALFCRPLKIMDDRHGSFLGLGGLGAGGGSGGLSKLSPYLSVDPAYLQTETPQYIFNQVRPTHSARPTYVETILRLKKNYNYNDSVPLVRKI